MENLKEEFMNPDDKFTPIPFWFWNDELNKEELSRQIQDFYDKGVMGFVIHPRIGIPNHMEYLSDSFMELVRFAVEEAEARGMKVILYDEAMYPSGSAHGMVVKDNPRYASCGLKMIEYRCMEKMEIKPDLKEDENLVAAVAVKKISSTAIYSENIISLMIEQGGISFVPPDQGEWSVLLFVEGFSKGTIRGIHFGEDDGEENAPPSSDLLNPDAMRKFIQLTHERYYEYLKDFFGSTVIAMFTDEPNILGRNPMPNMMPWTFGLMDWYIKEGNKKTDLPALRFEIGEETEEKRRNYKRAINKKLQEAYYEPIAKWCENHHIALTGHPESSEDIELLKTFHIPGQDVVWRWVAPEDQKGICGPHSTMAKCSSDIARHTGKTRNANECFGCCSPEGTQWGFSAADMKWYLDWLFARGVNLIYPHAFYYSIQGERRKNERPPDVGPNNSWWKYYKDIATYIKRMSWMMTDCVNATEVAILCEEDHLPWKIAKPLYESQIEFNYLDLSTFLSESCVVTEDGIKIQKQKYKVMIVEDAGLISAENRRKFQDFCKNGGYIIIYSPEGKKLSLEGAIGISNYEDIINVLDSSMKRDIVITPQCKDLRISHTVKEGIHFYTLVNEGSKRIEGKLYIRNRGKIEIWNPWKGTMNDIAVEEEQNGAMTISLALDYRESRILCLNPKEKSAQVTSNNKRIENQQMKEMTGEWKVYNNSQMIGTKQNLSSWTKWEGMKNFSGTIQYETMFSLEKCQEGKMVFLELGEVQEIAQVYINGEDAGYRMWRPYRFDISNCLKAGENQLIIEITNSLTNKMDQNNIASGLLGPVQLQFIG